MIEEEQPLKIQCVTCSAYFELAGGVKERVIQLDREQVKEVGLECPECGAWVHSFYQTARTRNTQAALNNAIALYQKQRTPRTLGRVRGAEKRHKMVFDTEQARLRMLLATVSPTAVLGQAVDDIDKLALDGADDAR
jgi:hypothetical protein